MAGEWEILSSETVLKDRWIDVRADRCRTPSGVEISPYYVLNYPDWVHVVAITTDDCLVLVHQYRHAVGEFILELPGGMVERSETDIETAARRELEEETGYRASAWRPVSVLYPNPAIQTNRVHVYVAWDAKTDGVQALDEGEEGLTLRLIPVSEVLKGLHSGLLGHGLHVSGILLALASIGRLELRG
jgi:8-oxo-dGTP pyrophosphatase MutT (NUDIX family)